MEETFVMSEKLLICRYCDCKWQEGFLFPELLKCPTCGDTNIRIKSISKDKVNYYPKSKVLNELQKEYEEFLDLVESHGAD